MINPPELPINDEARNEALIASTGMGVGRIFSRGRPGRDFPKAVKFVFYPSKLKKQLFFANNFNIQRGPSPLPPLPTPMNTGVRLY